jgi:large subunit ribosomal protein L28
VPRRCALTGKNVQFGHNVAHSNRKTNRRFEPNLQRVTLTSDALGRGISLRIAVRTLRSVQRSGGLDAWLLSHDDATLTDEALRLKRNIRKALATPRRTAASA